MKIAVLLSGHCRTFYQCKDNILEKTSVLSPDYFFNTYDIQYDYHPFIRNQINFHLENRITQDYFDENLYKKIRIDTPTNIDKIFYEQIRPDIHPSMIPPMAIPATAYYMLYWKWEQGLNLITEYEKEHGFEYDVVVIIRPDVFVKDLSELDFSNISSKIITNFDSLNDVNDHILISTKFNLYKMLDFVKTEFKEYKYPTSNARLPHSLLKNAIIHSDMEHKQFHILDFLLRENNFKIAEPTGV